MSDKDTFASGRTNTTSTGSESRQALETQHMARKASGALVGAPSTPETPRAGAVPRNFPSKSPAPVCRPTPAQRDLLSALARGRYPLRTTPRTVATCEAKGWLRREDHVGLLVLTNAGRALLAAPIAGDWVETIFEPRYPGFVLRVSRNGAWADVRWRERHTEWVERTPCDSLRIVTTVPLAGGTVTDTAREAELAASGGEARG